MCSKAHGNQHESLNLKPTSCSNSSHGQGLLVSCEENLRGRGTYDTEHFICTRSGTKFSKIWTLFCSAAASF